jgi:hypothetical protein
MRSSSVLWLTDGIPTIVAAMERRVRRRQQVSSGEKIAAGNRARD